MLGDAQHHVVKIHPGGPAGARGLQERGARARQLVGAQVKVRVEVDDPDPGDLLPIVLLVLQQPGKRPEGDLVAAAEHDRGAPGFQGRRDGVGQLAVGRVQLPIGAGHVPGVTDPGPARRDHVGQGRTDGRRPPVRAGSASVADHAFVAGEADEGELRGRCRSVHEVMVKLKLFAVAVMTACPRKCFHD